ncbi:MAG TPA: glycosyltransferase family 61 protein, partial [Solirubrobacterales bacterium]|nr:glycosyltransferase family 61 protein [Solirubrobacterales bacterium]
MAPEASSAAGRGPRGDLGLGGRHVLLPRGSLTFSGPRELLVNRTIAGAYETDGSLAPDTVRRVSGGAFTLDSVPRRLASQEVVRVYEEEAVWGGPLATPERRYQTPYGHFMVESVARLWPVLPDAELHGLPVVFVRPQRPPHAAEWLDAFGAPLVDLPEGGAVLFKRLFVPEPAWQEAAWIAPEVRDIHLHARRGMDVPRVSRRGVLWLSRSGLAPTRIPLGEDRLESSLDGRLSAVRPYTMTLAEQVAALEGASAVAGVVGSAFHTLLLTAETPDCLYLCPPWD